MGYAIYDIFLSYWVKYYNKTCNQWPTHTTRIYKPSVNLYSTFSVLDESLKQIHILISARKEPQEPSLNSSWNQVSYHEEIPEGEHLVASYHSPELCAAQVGVLTADSRVLSFEELLLFYCTKYGEL